MSNARKVSTFEDGWDNGRAYRTTHRSSVDAACQEIGAIFPQTAEVILGIAGLVGRWNREPYCGFPTGTLQIGSFRSVRFSRCRTDGQIIVIPAIAVDMTYAPLGMRNFMSSVINHPSGDDLGDFSVLGTPIQHEESLPANGVHVEVWAWRQSKGWSMRTANGKTPAPAR